MVRYSLCTYIVGLLLLHSSRVRRLSSPAPTPFTSVGLLVSCVGRLPHYIREGSRFESGGYSSSANT